MTLKTQAIQTALTGDWTSAITLNQELLRQNPQDVDALNRLAFAYSVIGKVREARLTYQKVLKIDALNPIAQRGLKRLSGYKPSPHDGNLKHSVANLSNIFLEETGKTKVIELINIADPKIISHLRTGEHVSLCIKRLKIFVLNENKHYVGQLADNIGKRLIKFIKGGNNYEAYIKSVDNKRITIFIREVKRAYRFRNQFSFVTDKSHLTFGKNHSLPKHDEDGEYISYSEDESL